MKNITIILGILLAFLVGMNIGGYFYKLPYSQNETAYEPSLSGYAHVQPTINSTTIYIASGCNVITFDVTADQAYSIANGMQNTLSSRPLTHDIMTDLMDVFGIQITQIKIDRYANGIYYTTIIFRSGDKVLELDARPSDAIALATRTKTPVYIRESFLELNGEKIC